MKHENKDTHILLIDGDCLLCHGITKFVYRRDSARRFRFASLQSRLGQQLLTKGSLPADLDTFVMIVGERYYTKSGAALRVLRQLDGWWPLAYSFIIVPTFIRDGVYNYIAKRRYRWFGRDDACMLPDRELSARFLDDEFFLNT